MKTKVYIAKNFEGRPVSIVLAASLREAQIFWQGKGIIGTSEVEIDPESVDTPLGILEILRTESVRVRDSMNNFEVVGVKR